MLNKNIFINNTFLKHFNYKTLKTIKKFIIILIFFKKILFNYDDK